jgi:hypothetical protein
MSKSTVRIDGSELKIGGGVASLRTVNDSSRWALASVKSIPRVHRWNAALLEPRGKLSSLNGVLEADGTDVLNAERYNKIWLSKKLLSLTFEDYSSFQAPGSVTINSVGMIISLNDDSDLVSISFGYDGLPPVAHKGAHITTSKILQAFSENVDSGIEMASQIAKIVPVIPQNALDSILRPLTVTMSYHDACKRVTQGITAWISTMIGVDLEFVSVDDLGVIARKIITCVPRIPISNIVSYCQYENFVDELISHPSPNNLGFRFHPKSKLLTRDDGLQSFVNQFAHDAVPRKLLMKRRIAMDLTAGITLSYNDFTLSEIDIIPTIDDELKSFTVEVVHAYTKLSSEVAPADLSFSYIREHPLSECILVYPDIVCEYDYDNGKIMKFTPLVHEFIRRAIRHIRLFIRAPRGVIPFDQVLPLDPIMIIGKSAMKLPSRERIFFNKFCILVICMYTNAKFPSEAIKLLESVKQDKDRFAVIVENIDNWITDYAATLEWGPKLLYSESALPPLSCARFGGCDSQLAIECKRNRKERKKIVSK